MTDYHQLLWSCTIDGKTCQDKFKDCNNCQKSIYHKNPHELRPYEKNLFQINSTQANSDEGKVTQQTCGRGHPLVYARLTPKEVGKKTRWVLCCFKCGFYEEVP